MDRIGTNWHFLFRFATAHAVCARGTESASQNAHNYFRRSVSGLSIFRSPHAARVLFLVAAAAAVADGIHQGNEREEHGDDDTADNHGQKHDHDGFQQ